jgi:hypothetical protein
MARAKRASALWRASNSCHSSTSPAACCWQQAADAAHGRQFFGFALGIVGGGVDNHIAGIDFAQVVNQQHADDLVEVQLHRCVFGHGEGQQGNLPAVFGRVFIAIQPDRLGLAQTDLSLSTSRMKSICFCKTLNGVVTATGFVVAGKRS